MIDLEKLETPELERLLRIFREKAVPYATRHMLNKAGWRARGIAQDDIRRDFVNRNKWTVGSVRVIPTRSLVVRQQEVRVGSTQEYMRFQEEGHTEVSKGKHGVPIPTSYSAGQAGRRPRTRLPRRPNQMRNIQLRRGGKGQGSATQRAIRAIKESIVSGNKTIFIDFGPGKRKGIFRVLGGKRNTRIRMIQDLSQRSVRIPQHKWLEPAVEQAQKGMPDDYRDGLLFQLRRLPRFR
jgi:hypothetical protein